MSAVYKKETSKGQRENRFTFIQDADRRRKNETLRLKREAHLKEIEEKRERNKPKDLI